ncbi:MAG: ATP-binding cassette domain-containing protein, partial [Eggerthellaceae bacterium]
MAQPSIHSSGSSKPETLLRVEDLVKSYPAFELRNVSFSVEAGTITGFIGRNGAGKSTTLKCLEGAVHPDG